MRLCILYGLASAALGIAFAAGLNIKAHAAAPADLAQACKEVTVSNDLIQKAVTLAGVAHRSARRTSRAGSTTAALTEPQVYARAGFSESQSRLCTKSSAPLGGT